MFFTARIDGAWRCRADATLDHDAPAALARHHLRERVGHVLARYSVLDAPAAQDAVNASTARWFSPDTGLDVHGTARLAVGHEARDLAEEHLRAERSGDLDREETLRRITFLQHILSDPDRRTVWWVDQYPDRLGELGDVHEKLSDLKPPHDPSHDTLRGEVIRFIDQLLADIRTPQQREVFLRALTQTLQSLGSTELQALAAQWLPPAEPDPGSAPQ